MGIQSSLNSLLSQAQMLATFYKGFDKADKIIKDQKITKNEAKIQTDIAAGNAPMKDGKVDPEWLKKQREEFDNSEIGKRQKQIFQNEINRNNDPSLADLLAKYDTKNAAIDSAIETQSTNSKLKNEVAEKLARASVEARTDSINKTKSNFDEHVASLIKYYGKGSGNP